MAALPILKIGGVEIALQTFAVNQTYRRIAGETLHRMQSGAGEKQSHWEKLGTSITGEGWAPAALAGIDWKSSVEILCVQPRSISSATVNATLPAARRSDLTTNVWAFAVVNGELVPAAVSVVTNAATATTVASATSYQFYYYPKITCFSSGPTESLDMTGAAYGWSLEAEEV